MEESESTRSEVLSLSQKLLENEPSAAFQKILHLLCSHHEAGCQAHELCREWRAARAYLLAGPYEDVAVRLLGRMEEDVEYMENYLPQITAILTKGPLDITLEVKVFFLFRVVSYMWLYYTSMLQYCWIFQFWSSLFSAVMVCCSFCGIL